MDIPENIKDCVKIKYEEKEYLVDPESRQIVAELKAVDINDLPKEVLLEFVRLKDRQIEALQKELAKMQFDKYFGIKRP